MFHFEIPVTVTVVCVRTDRFCVQRLWWVKYDPRDEVYNLCS